MITILGPTAGGKTTVAAHLAANIGGEVISGDSRQVYCGMDIGTGKDLDEYTVGSTVVPYHLIDIVDVGYKYNVYEYVRDFGKVYADMCNRGKQPILCGGSGLYIEAAVSGYAMPTVDADTELRTSLEKQSTPQLIQTLSALQTIPPTLDIQNRRRLVRAIEVAMCAQSAPPPISPVPNVYVCISYDRETRRTRITERLQQRLRSGMVEEVQGLMEHGISAETLYYYGLEYRYVALYLTGRLTYSQMVERLGIAIHQFAKRQMTWFRGMERRGAVIHPINGELSLEEKIEKIKQLANV